MTTAIVLISAEPGKDRKVAHAAKKLAAVRETFLVSGLYDVVATVKARTAEEILALVYDRIRTIPGVKNSQTMFALEV